MYIPEAHKVDDLIYGAHVARPEYSGYYVRVEDGPWIVARLTPASDELPDDGDYVDAYWQTVRQTLEEQFEQADFWQSAAREDGQEWQPSEELTDFLFDLGIVDPSWDDLDALRRQAENAIPG